MSAAASAIAIAASAASIASAGVSIAGNLSSNAQGGNSTAWANQLNQQLAQRQATIARDRAASDAADIERSNRRAIGGLRAAAGASGLLVDDGSALDAAIESAGAGELNRQRRLWEGKLEAEDALIGGLAAQRTFTPTYGGLAVGGSQLLTGVSKVRDLLDTRGGYSLGADKVRTAGDRDLGGYGG